LPPPSFAVPKLAKDDAKGEVSGDLQLFGKFTWHFMSLAVSRCEE